MTKSTRDRKVRVEQINVKWPETAANRNRLGKATAMIKLHISIRNKKEILTVMRSE